MSGPQTGPQECRQENLKTEVLKNIISQILFWKYTKLNSLLAVLAIVMVQNMNRNVLNKT